MFAVLKSLPWSLIVRIVLKLVAKWYGPESVVAVAAEVASVKEDERTVERLAEVVELVKVVKQARKNEKSRGLLSDAEKAAAVVVAEKAVDATKTLGAYSRRKAMPADIKAKRPAAK